MRRYLILIVLLIVGAIAGLVTYAHFADDRDLVFSRIVPTNLDPESLDRALRATINWPDWFSSTRQAEILDGLGRPYPMTDQLVQKGSQVRLTIDPRKGKWKEFELMIAVAEYQQKARLRLTLLGDSKGRLTRLFSGLTWEIAIEPRTDGKPGALLHSTTRARTQHWRSRLFGLFAERILLNQATYPDVIKLAELKQPKEPNPFFPTQR